MTADNSLAAPANDRATMLKGAALMAMGVLLLPGADGLAKWLSADYSPLFISWMRYALASMMLLPVALFRFGREIFPRARLGSNILRTVLLITAMTLYFMAIATVPLTSAITIFLIGPILAVPLGALMLGEAMTGRKIIALALGFTGALVILRPQGGMAPGMVLALAAGICFAFYLIASRRASQASDPLKTAMFQYCLGALLLTPQAVWTWKLPAGTDIPLFLALGLISMVSHLLSITAFRYTEASLLAPLVYLELIGALIVGYLFFDEWPDLMGWTGACFIVAGGGILIGRRPRPLACR